MTRLVKFLSWLAIDGAKPELAVAQYRELQRQVPFLYSLLSVNALAVAFTHRDLAPATMTLWVPGFLTALCIIRLIVWTRRGSKVLCAQEVIAKLRRAIVLAALIAAVHIAWALSLSNYGGPYEQAHVALFVAITVIGCFSCLMHLPQAAVVVAVVVTIPNVCHYMSMQNAIFAAIALNILLVTGVMIQVLVNGFAGFEKLLYSEAEMARLGEENARLAHTDALTGLPNRRHFFAQLVSRVESLQAGGPRFAVGIFDLDHFKQVNDTYGHVFGDRLLAIAGKRLSYVVGPGMMIARLGGDEFGFLATTDVDKAQATGQSICDLLVEAYPIGDMQISVGCSCGVAISPDAGPSVHELFDRADYALYNSKTARRGTATLYSADHEVRIRTERAIESALQAADFETEMAVHFQPIVDTGLNRVIAVESLARWTSPTLGVVRPDIFIAVAERTGLIHKLTLTLFRKSLAQIETLPAEIGLSFNLSAQDVSAPQTVLAIVSALRLSGVDPRRLTFELTETAVMRDFSIAAESIRLLRSLGSTIALDDFGTGYSSLGHLHRLPLDRVKIDRSFVHQLDQPAGRKLVASIIGMCRTLGLECVVEGVEKTEQLAILGELGCHMVQGFLFAPPLAPADLRAWMAGLGDGHAARLRA